MGRSVDLLPHVSRGVRYVGFCDGDTEALTDRPGSAHVLAQLKTGLVTAQSKAYFMGQVALHSDGAVRSPKARLARRTTASRPRSSRPKRARPGTSVIAGVIDDRLAGTYPMGMLLVR
jgi:hypothetical protein